MEPHPYYLAHYTEIESVVLLWRGYTENDAKKVIVASEVMEKMISRKASLLAGGLDPAQADDQRVRAEVDYDREKPGIREQAYGYMRNRLANWKAGQMTSGNTGCLFLLGCGVVGLLALGRLTAALL